MCEEGDGGVCLAVMVYAEVLVCILIGKFGQYIQHSLCSQDFGRDACTPCRGMSEGEL